MLSPMMQHYLDTKKQNPDCILFYRLGDFYEMFFEDAKTVSKELDLFLTGKECGLEERAPMCGVPFHAAESYINRLVEKGYKVAIAEQVEDPRQAKGLVKREVVRIVTPGTIMNDDALEAGRNHYIMSIIYLDGSFGISICDITTGAFYLTQVQTTDLVVDEIEKYQPSEIICSKSLSISKLSLSEFKDRCKFVVTELPDKAFDDATYEPLLKAQFGEAYAETFALQPYETGILSAGALIWYLHETQKNSLTHINEIKPYKLGMYMVLDSFTRRNLELTETLRDKEKKGSLAYVLDETRTAMGSRMLRSFIEQPLIDKKEIIRRQSAVEYFVNNMMLREELREYLNPIRDLERLMARIAYGSVNPKELVSFSASLAMIPHIKLQLKDSTDSLVEQIYEEMDELADVTRLIGEAINDDPPLTIHDGGIIKDGYNEDVDKYRKAKNEGKAWLANFESKERERTGISKLRIKYSRVFGYCIEVTNSFLANVPDNYIRRQTLTNAERFTTPELKELEETILGAEEKLFTLEYNLFVDIREQVASNVLRIKKTANAIGTLDTICSFADVAVRKSFVKPTVNDGHIIDIKGGRHPVVEDMLGDGLFIKNDTYLDNSENLVSIITGPNMAGKSTYMLQSALIVLMAQIGSFVPADSATIGVCDRIFTRVGASDDLASGQSTFMVEMNEVANILKHATKKSLLILDEIGRGTSTFDGLAIAWSVVEYICNKLGAKTLFATHYHELTELEGYLAGVQNYCIAVKEQGEDIVFLRKIIKGGADKSYGIQVAKLAGVPEDVLKRAYELVDELSNADIATRAREIASGNATATDDNSCINLGGAPSKAEVGEGQISLFDDVLDDDILKEILGSDLAKLTPIDALNKLYVWQEALKNRWK